MSWTLKRFAKMHVLLLLVLATSGLCLCRPLCVGGSDAASSRIGEADDEVRQAFKAVLEAEAAGANISGLIANLDGAGRLLAEAEIVYGQGNASEALAKADSSFSIAHGVRAEAAGLKSSALAHNVLQWDLAFSLAGTVASVLILLLVWAWFKRVYVKRLLRLRPEVASDAEA
jgi:hypothetical protein